MGGAEGGGEGRGRSAGRRDYSHVRVCVHGNEDSVRGRSPVWIYIARVRFSRPATLAPRAERRGACTIHTRPNIT